MNEAKLKKAWAIFDKAANLEASICGDPTKGDNLKRIACKNADKKLDEAAALEAEAFAE